MKDKKINYQAKREREEDYIEMKKTTCIFYLFIFVVDDDEINLK